MIGQFMKAYLHRPVKALQFLTTTITHKIFETNSSSQVKYRTTGKI